MIYSTFAQIERRIRLELEILDEEDSVSEEELLSFINDGIDYAESNILTLYEDYFLTSDTITIRSGTSEYDLPDNLYAGKTRSVIYNDGSDVYAIKKVRGKDLFLQLEDINLNGTDEAYKYIIKNAEGDLPKLVLYPPARGSGSFITIWYLRNANKMVDDTSICDIPEALPYIIAYGKWAASMKIGFPDADSFKQEMENQKILLIETLTRMVPDDDTELKVDTSFYEGHN